MNLLLISIDSLRLDFVSRTGTRVCTPRFDALTRDFAFSTRLFSTSSATRPVHTSMFTGLYPFEHGILGQHFLRQRAGIPNLFPLFQQNCTAIGGFSEASVIFTGLDYAPFIAPLPSLASAGLRQIDRFLSQHRAAPQFLFVHYWSTHTPYGAPDGKAFGQVGRLLRTGQRHQVEERYARAVETLFETKIAPLLSRIDLGKWSVFILSDHGESWTADDPYHGQTLSNAVLRVPLYLHLPHTGNPALPRPLLSVVDLFPTINALFSLPVDYRGFGRDLRQEDQPDYCLAQIHPAATPGTRGAGPQWALFDIQRKFTYDEECQEGRLETTLTEEELADPRAANHYTSAYAAMRAQSVYACRPLEHEDQAQEERLEQRLRDLGYLA
jgi:hypothetical protein